MANYATSNIRTVALVGQGGSGKTTLAEALLLASGAIKEAGVVERGTTVSDFEPLEKTWQHSLRASIVHLDTQDTRVHLIDTPGFPDFIGQAIGALDAVETAAAWSRPRRPRRHSRTWLKSCTSAPFLHPIAATSNGGSR